MIDILTRIKQKHDSKINWSQSNLVPLCGELIIYDKETTEDVARIKIGDGVTPVNQLPFIDESIRIDYDSLLAFDTSEIVFGINTSSVLGQAVLGQMILA